MAELRKEYPILEFDPHLPAQIEPREQIKPIKIPEHCVITFFNNELNKRLQKKQLTVIKKLKTETGAFPVFLMQAQHRDIAIFHPGVGAPLAAAMLEEVIALGANKFIACGGAGALRSELSVGKLLIPTAAVRDEGTSYHYLPPSREVAASIKAVSAIRAALDAENCDYEMTKTWTTDALYRETPGKIALRKSEGCSTVEMEAAAMFAVAQFRNVKLAQILYAGDDLAGEKWSSRGWTKETDIRSRLIDLAAQACLRL